MFAHWWNVHITNHFFFKLDILNNLMSTLSKRCYKMFLLAGFERQIEETLFITAQVWSWDGSLFHSDHLAQCVLCEEVGRRLNPGEWWNRPQSYAFKEAIVPIMIRWSLLKSEQLIMKRIAPCQRWSWLFISCNAVCNPIQVHNYQQLGILNQICLCENESRNCLHNKIKA